MRDEDENVHRIANALERIAHSLEQMVSPIPPEMLAKIERELMPEIKSKAEDKPVTMYHIVKVADNLPFGYVPRLIQDGLRSGRQDLFVAAALDDAGDWLREEGIPRGPRYYGINEHEIVQDVEIRRP